MDVDFSSLYIVISIAIIISIIYSLAVYLSRRKEQKVLLDQLIKEETLLDKRIAELNRSELQTTDAGRRLLNFLDAPAKQQEKKPFILPKAYAFAFGALLITFMFGTVSIGMVTSGSELFNTSQLQQAANAQATAASLDNEGRQVSMRATQTVVAVTQAAESLRNQNGSAPAQATRQAGYWQATLSADHAQATRAAFERQVKADERQDQFNTISQYMAVGAALVMAGVLVALTVLLGKYVRAREREARGEPAGRTTPR